MESAAHGHGSASFLPSGDVVADSVFGDSRIRPSDRAGHCSNGRPFNCDICQHLTNNEHLEKCFCRENSQSRESTGYRWSNDARGSEHGLYNRSSDSVPAAPRNLPREREGNAGTVSGSAALRFKPHRFSDRDARTVELLHQSPQNTIWLTECSQNRLQMSFEPPVIPMISRALPNQSGYLPPSHSNGFKHCSSHCRCFPVGGGKSMCSLPCVTYYRHASYPGADEQVDSRVVSPPPLQGPLDSPNYYGKHRFPPPQNQHSVAMPLYSHKRSESPSFEEDFNSSMEVPDSGLINRQSWSLPESSRSFTSKESDDSFCLKNMESPPTHSKPRFSYSRKNTAKAPDNLSGSDLSVARYKRHLYRSISAPQPVASPGDRLHRPPHMSSIRDTRGTSHCNSQDSAFVSESHFGGETSVECAILHRGSSVSSVSEYPSHSLCSSCRKSTSINEQLEILFSKSDFIRSTPGKVKSIRKGMCPSSVSPAVSSSCESSSRRTNHSKLPLHVPRSFSANSMYKHEDKEKRFDLSVQKGQVTANGSGRAPSTSFSSEEARNRRRRLDTAFAEFELLFEQLSVRLEDEELLDRAERRDLPTQHQLLWRTQSDSSVADQALPDVCRKSGSIQLWSPNKVLRKVNKCKANDFFFRKVSGSPSPSMVDSRDIVFRTGSYMLMSPAHSSKLSENADQSSGLSGDPDIVADDVAYRKHLLANSVHIVDPQPPFGIPVSVHMPLSTSSSYLRSPVPGSGERRRSSCRPRQTADTVFDDLAYRALRRDGDDCSPCRSLSPPRSRGHTPNTSFVQYRQGSPSSVTGCNSNVRRNDVVAASKRSNACAQIRCVCDEHDVSDSDLEISDAVKLSLCRSFRCRSRFTSTKSKPGALYSMFVEDNERYISGHKSSSSVCSTRNSYHCSSSRSWRPFYDSFSSPLKYSNTLGQLRSSHSLESICSEILTDGRRLPYQSLPNCAAPNDGDETTDAPYRMRAPECSLSGTNDTVISSPNLKLYNRGHWDLLSCSSADGKLISSRLEDGDVEPSPANIPNSSDRLLVSAVDEDCNTSQSFISGSDGVECGFKSAGVGQCLQDSLVEDNASTLHRRIEPANNCFSSHSYRNGGTSALQTDECDKSSVTPVMPSLQQHSTAGGGGCRTGGGAEAPGEGGSKECEWMCGALMAASLLQLVLGSAGLLPLLWLLALALAVAVSLIL